MESLLYRQDLVAISDLQKKQILQILAVASLAQSELEQGRKLNSLLRDKIIATLFFEPSTRTRLSFESATGRLGGRVISTADGGKTSSAVKGETIADTAHMASLFADVIVSRHWQVGSAREFADNASVPVINAGDGSGEHPTQALLDVYTILKEKGTIDGLHIVLVGDLKHGRTTHSLLQVLQHWNVKVTLVSPIELSMPIQLVEEMMRLGMDISISHNMEEATETADVVYMTRMQEERFDNPSLFEKLQNSFMVDADFMRRHPNVILMHPLPRKGEIPAEVDDFENAVFFRQAQNGLYVRAALLALIIHKRVNIARNPIQRAIDKVIRKLF